jgi:hypothetical protein
MFGVVNFENYPFRGIRKIGLEFLLVIKKRAVDFMTQIR